MDYTLKINDFEGPLDLLLHLIKEAKMSVFDFSVEEIIKSYLDYINKMQEINLTIASSYLVMASELIEIKSKMLLPRQPEEEDEEDPKENLINRLVEYQKYKELTSDFNEYKQDKIELVSDVSVDDLIDAFKKFLERQKDNIVLETKVTKKGISIEQRRAEIKNIIFKRRKVNFFELFDVLTREYLVVTFLAILEMTRKREINIKQENNFDEIICEVA